MADLDSRDSSKRLYELETLAGKLAQTTKKAQTLAPIFDAIVAVGESQQTALEITNSIFSATRELPGDLHLIGSARNSQNHLINRVDQPRKAVDDLRNSEMLAGVGPAIGHLVNSGKEMQIVKQFGDNIRQLHRVVAYAAFKAKTEETRGAVSDLHQAARKAQYAKL